MPIDDKYGFAALNAAAKGEPELPRVPAQTPGSQPPLVRPIARSVAVYAIECASVACAAWLAFMLRFDFNIPAFYQAVLLAAVACWIPVKLASFKLLGLDRRWARYVSVEDLSMLAFSNFAASVVSLLILAALKSGVPRSVYVIDLLLCTSLTAGLRVFTRLTLEALQGRSLPRNRTRAIVYGAGNAGAALLRDLRQNTALQYDIRGFVDDNPRKLGLVLYGVRVLGNGDSLGQIAKKQRANLVLIAIPAATGPEMKRIIERCMADGIRYKTVPGLAELIDDSGLARQIRDVAVEDLLGRVPVRLEQHRISAQIFGSVVLVTGAAGSIGSEICRQIARFRPAAVVGLEIAESPLFGLQQEFARTFPEIPFHAEIGSIQKPGRLAEVFRRYRPSVVYHAAAYKHVPLMESHIFEAIENNVFGTLNVVEAARSSGVSQFVMISSDKAVRPTNVMGATKRVAELLVRSLQPPDATYVSVRFGNVLGSNGSVVPIFKEQIARGGPVTVTHPDMRRYFMTIPEACQLVLQASTMGHGSEIFVLDMGDPVRIVDLARNLILLSGLRPERDIRIEFTGARPGEKLYEEISVEDEGLLPTHHDKIRVFAGATKPWQQMAQQLAELRRACVVCDVDLSLSVLKEIVPEYTPSASVSGTAEPNAAAETVTAEAGL